MLICVQALPSDFDFTAKAAAAAQEPAAAGSRAQVLVAVSFIIIRCLAAAHLTGGSRLPMA